MTQELFYEISQWQKETFGESTSQSKLFHLIDEIKELNEAIVFQKEDKRLEFADCFFLLFGAAASDGMTYEDICNAIQEKFEINKKRKWGKPNENGIVNHVKNS